MDDVDEKDGSREFMALQWGHGEFAVDDVKIDAATAPPIKLQWGHGEFAVDDMALLN